MKRILTILTVALISCATVFAAVDFSGSFTTGLGIQYEDEDWDLYLFGDDDDGTREATLSLGISDDEGLWSVNIVGYTDTSEAIEFDASGKLGAEVNLSISKLIGDAMPFDIEFFTTVYDRTTALRAYNNVAGNNYDRVRTDDDLTSFGLTFGYADFIDVQLAWTPGKLDSKNKFDTTNQQALLSALIAPVNGLKVSIDYGYNTEDRSNSDIYSSPETDLNDNEHTIAAALDLDLGTILDMDASFGVSVSERYQVTDKYNAFSAVVYGGIPEASAYLEYANLNRIDDDADNNLQLGVSGDVGSFSYNTYFGAEDVLEFRDTYYLGAEVYYTLSSLTFGLGIEYAESSSYNYQGHGLWIAPSLSIAF